MNGSLSFKEKDMHPALDTQDEVKPICKKCGKDDSMFQHSDGEWVCHHTHILEEDPSPIDKPVNEIAVEDLITITCETFVEQLSEMSNREWIDKVSQHSLHEWYMAEMTDADRRRFSEVLYDRIKKDMDIINGAKENVK